MKHIRLIPLAAAAALLFSGCEDSTKDAPDPATGTLHAALTFVGTTHDVAAMSYRVVGPDDDCDGEAIAEALVGLEEEALPAWVAAGAGDNHAFADALFVLQPGDYKVCVTPLQDNGEPSAVCAAAEGIFTVVAEATTEGVLYAQCLGDPSGGLDVIAALNNPPHIDDLDIAASKFITTCEDAIITVTASDPDGDALSYTFTVTAAPDGAAPTLVVNGNQATFHGDVEGPYTLQVDVDDGLGGVTHLAFPIHVSDCPVADQCFLEYAVLSERDRSVGFNDGNCGGQGNNVEICDEGPAGTVLCGPPGTVSHWQGSGWYRIDGDAGVQMPEDAPGDFSCGTDAAGWLNGSHPLVEEGVVDGEVCFDWLGNACNWSAPIELVNCGGFYLYNLVQPPASCLRYCGSPAL